MQTKTSFIRRILAGGFALILGITVLFTGCSMTEIRRGQSYRWALNVIENFYIWEFDPAEASEETAAALAALLDDYSAYYTAEEYAALIRENSGERSGIGVSYSFVGGRGVLIVQVIGNSPAFAAGIRKGDLFTGGRTENGENVVFTDSASFSSFIEARATGERFALLRAEGEEVLLAKAVYQSAYTSMATNDSSWAFCSSGDGSGLSLIENNDDKLTFLPEHAAYVSLSQFYGTATQEFGALMGKFIEEGCTSLILDLRNNGGGYVSVMQGIAGFFTSGRVDSAVAMTAQPKAGEKEVYYCETQDENRVPEGTEVYVLANAGTASASEALIGVLVSYDMLKYENIFLSDYSQEYLDWAGEGAKTGRSYGKGIMQSTFLNSFTGEALKLTTAEIFWPNGKSIHGVGLTEKDKCTLVAADWVVTPGDEELQRVVETIRSR